MKPGGRDAKRSGRAAILAVAMALAATLLPPPVEARPTNQIRDPRDARAAAALRKCKTVPHARCGSISVPLDRSDPSVGNIRIGFELFHRSDRSRPKLGTIVATEGGPGYSTTDSRSSYLPLMRPLMDRRDLLLVDNRGTGRSDPILCRWLQSYRGDYVDAAGRCGRKLGDTADLYGTGNAADDLAAVLNHLGIAKVDLYGDSYGTFFGQTFAVRHPNRLRSLVLDSAYFVGGTDPFYIDTNRALRDAFRFVCQRDPGCSRRPGGPMRRIARLTEQLRQEPIVGRAPDADGELARVKVGVGGLIYLTTSAATSFTLYRELDAAIRAALRKERPYNLPLLRLARETYYEGGGGPVRSYSEGLYLAVLCNDTPQPYDMTSPVSQRPAQYEQTLDQLRQNQPKAFRPFTIREWIRAPVEYFDSCIKWPPPSRVDLPIPPGATFPNVPTLVLAGDVDSLTSPEGAQDTANAFPDSTYVEVANMTHVAAISDFGRCASTIVRRFIRELAAGDTSCASEYAEVRAVDVFARHASGLGWDRGAQRRARVAAATVADVIARWWGMYGSSGVGLAGGRFTTTGLRVVRWNLEKVRLVKGVKVSGEVKWVRPTGVITADVTVAGGSAREGRLRMRWNDYEPHATATARGDLGGDAVRFSFPAP